MSTPCWLVLVRQTRPQHRSRVRLFKKTKKQNNLDATESKGRKASDTQNYIYVLKKSRHGSAASFLLYLDCNLTMFRESREERPRQPSSTHLQREASMIIPLYIGIRTPYPPRSERVLRKARQAFSAFFTGSLSLL